MGLPVAPGAREGHDQRSKPALRQVQPEPPVRALVRQQAAHVLAQVGVVARVGFSDLSSRIVVVRVDVSTAGRGSRSCARRGVYVRYVVCDTSVSLFCVLQKMTMGPDDVLSQPSASFPHFSGTHLPLAEYACPKAYTDALSLGLSRYPFPPSSLSISSRACPSCTPYVCLQYATHASLRPRSLLSRQPNADLRSQTVAALHIPIVQPSEILNVRRRRNRWPARRGRSLREYGRALTYCVPGGD
ncbi:hypothetical protein NUW54_g12516 [Trametes sanguinea]|uniref:Uncharacterized protein n=1 Tax=Trametes sanguinea TaxID=158606 RepID=A0ACC1MXR1_9APHY|nr:hypothetical protein NUW54_g12516 [Trametes sanguinea]